MLKKVQKGINRVIFYPSSKNMVPISKKHKEWNDRFHIERMPQYKAQDDVHCCNYFLSKPNVKQPNRGISSSQNKNRDDFNNPNLVENYNEGTFLKYVDNRETRKIEYQNIMDRLKLKLTKIWDEYSISQQLRNAFLNSIEGMNIKLYVEICAKEIQKSSKGMGYMQIIQSSLTERLLLIDKLKEISKFINQRKTLKDNKDVISNIMGDLINLRMITLKYVEAIMSFNGQIKCNYQLSGINAVIEKTNMFLLISQNFYNQISSDTLFLYNSPLAETFQFFSSNDPFLLYNSNTNPDSFEDLNLNESKTSRSSQSKCIFLPLPYDIKRRIVEAEFAMRPDIERQEVALKKVVKVRLKKNQTKNIPKINPLKNRKSALDKLNSNIHSTKNNNIGNQSYMNKKHLNQKEGAANNYEKNSTKLTTIQRNSNAFNSPDGSQKIQATFDNNKEKNINDLNDHLMKMDSDNKSNLKNKEEPITNDMFKNLRLKGLHIKESKIISLLENYFSKLSFEMRSSFDNPKELLKKAKECRGHFWLGYHSNENLLGLAVLGIDKGSILTKRIVILNATMIDESNYEILIEELIDFIMRNFSCNEIKIELRHFKVGDELKIFPLVKEKLAKFKFKWKNISNNSPEERILILCRPNPNPINDLRFFNFSVEANICTILGLHKSPTDPISDQSSETFIISSKIEAIRTMEQKIKELNFTKSEDTFPSYYSNVKEYFNFNSGQKLFSTEIEDINSIMKVPNVNNLSEYTGFSLSFQNISFNFDSYDYSRLEVENISYKYIRVRTDIKKFKYENNIVLVFPTSEKQISAFIIFNSANSEIKEVKGILNNIPDIEPEEQEIWIPSFEKKDFSSSNTITNLETNKGFISTLKEALHLQLTYEEPIEGSIECDMSTDSILITSPFVFGISDERIEKPFDSYVLYTKINTNHWIRV